MKSEIINDNYFKFTYPNDICFTNSPYAYARIQRLMGNVVNDAITLTIKHEELGEVKVERETNASGGVVFPIGGILSAMCGDSGYIRDVVLDVSIGDWSYESDPILAIAGFADGEVKNFDNQNGMPSNWPQIPFLIVYPTLTQTVFFPVASNIVSYGNEQGNVRMMSSPPFIECDMGQLEWTGEEKTLTMQSFFARPNNSYIKIDEMNIPIDVDFCTSGVFVKWVDKHGIPYVYRWTQEMSGDELQIADTSTHLDDFLVPYDVQNKTITTTYTLHSRRVRQEIFDLCKTILGAHDIFLLDGDTWRRCYVSEGKAEDNGDILKDFTVKLERFEYNL